MADIMFTLPEALRAQKHLRDALGLGEERFPVPAFVNMISDEIDQLRGAGKSDQDIAALIEDSTGHLLTAQDIERYYTPEEDRHSNAQ